MMYEKWFSQDLRENVSVRHCESVVFEGDANTYLVGVAITDGGADVTLTGTVSCKVIRPDGATVTFAGDKEGGRLWAVLNKSSLSYAGQIAVVLQLVNTVNEATETITLLKAIFSNEPTTTDTIVDPGNVIPSLEELLAQIDTMNQGTARANAAAAALEDMTVEAHAVANNTPTAEITETGGHYNIDFGLVPATISSQSTQYQVSTSGTTVPTGTWLDAVPTVPQGQFLWTRSTINWNGGQQTLIYSVSRQGIDGSGAVSTVNGISPDANGNVALTIDAAPTQSSTNPVQSGGVYTAISNLSASVQEDISDVSDDVTALSSSLDTLEGNVATIEGEVTSHTSEIASLDTRVSDIENNPLIDLSADVTMTKSSGSNATLVGYEIYRRGNVVTFSITMKSTGTISAGSAMAYIDVTGAPVPVINPRAVMYHGSSIIFGNYSKELGRITVTVLSAALAANNTFMLTFVYLAAPEEEPEPEEET